MNLPPYGDEFRRTNNHLSSLKVTASPDPDMFVNISAGGFWLSNEEWIGFVGGRSPGFTAPSSNAKWDLLCLHYTGSPMIIPGTPSANPELPQLERKAFPLAAIYLEQGDAKITSDKIFDLRLFFATSYYHRDLEDRDYVDSHPIDAITGLRDELDQIEAGGFIQNLLNSKADIDGTPSVLFTLNKDFTGVPSSSCGIVVERGSEGNAQFRYNENINQWEYTNDGYTWVQLTNEGPSVTLPIAAADTLGGIKVGARLTINSSTGVLDANVQTSNDFTNTYKEKLDSIEFDATADMTPAEIKTSYESNTDTNAYTDAEKTKLAGIEAGATSGEMSAGDIKTAYESNPNTNAYTDAEKNKLSTVEAGATGDMTAVEIKASYESNLDTNAYTDAEKLKLTGVAVNANDYVHPVQHPPSIIAQDSNNRFVTDAEKTFWGGKADTDNYWSKSELAATGGTADKVDWSQLKNVPSFGSDKWLDPVEDINARDALTPELGDCVLVQDDGDGKAAQYAYNGTAWVKIGDVDWAPLTDAQVKTAYEANADTNAYTDAEKTKLAGIANNANDFTLTPATADTLGGVTIGSGLSVNTNGLIALSFDDTEHGARGGGVLHQVVNTSTAGFMSSGDKTKLDGIQNNANLYELPVASDTILGGVKIDPTGGILLDVDTSQISISVGAVGTLGLVGVENQGNINISNGLISISEADAATFGVVQVGENININSGVISVSHATAGNLGLVQIGDNIILDDVTGTISIDWTALPFDDTMHGARGGGNLHALATQAVHGFMSSVDKIKIDSVESGATGDMTAAEIKTAYESNTDTNAYTDAEKTKLAGIEDNATADMSAAEIKTAYESNTDTNAFTDTLLTKLNGIEDNANDYVHPATHPSTMITYPITTIISVDVNRADSYTADGSFTKPFKTLTNAIANAPAGDVLFRIAPGTYTENIDIEAGMHFICDSVENNDITKIVGTIRFDTNNTTGGADGNIASFSGIDISSDGVNPTVQFYGTNPQRLNLFNSKATSSGLQPALLMNNTGTGSTVVCRNTDFYNTGSGLAINASSGILTLLKGESNSSGTIVSNQFTGTAQIDSKLTFFTGQMTFADTAGGQLINPIINASANSAISNLGGTLILSTPVNLGTGDLIDSGSTGTIEFKTQSDNVAYSAETPANWTSPPAQIKSALDELASRVAALEAV